MNSNPVNAINPEWLDDCDIAIAAARSANRPVVLTGVPSSNTFCAGLDLMYVFAVCAECSRCVCAFGYFSLSLECDVLL